MQLNTQYPSYIYQICSASQDIGGAINVPIRLFNGPIEYLLVFSKNFLLDSFNCSSNYLNPIERLVSSLVVLPFQLVVMLNFADKNRK